MVIYTEEANRDYKGAIVTKGTETGKVTGIWSSRSGKAQSVDVTLEDGSFANWSIYEVEIVHAPERNSESDKQFADLFPPEVIENESAQTLLKAAKKKGCDIEVVAQWYSRLTAPNGVLVDLATCLMAEESHEQAQWAMIRGIFTRPEAPVDHEPQKYQQLSLGLLEQDSDLPVGAFVTDGLIYGLVLGYGYITNKRARVLQIDIGGGRQSVMNPKEARVI